MMIAALFSSQTLAHLLQQFGYAAVFGFVMVESLGVPFPGETMLIAAALYAGTRGHLSIGLVWVAAAAGAIIGDNIGYAIGRRGGYRLVRRHGTKVRIDEGKLKIGRLLFARHGGKVVFLGRFVSILRTYAAFLAGTNRMPYWRFFAFNASGGALWSAIFAFGFYYLGSRLKRVTGPLDIALAVVAAIVVIAFVVWTRRHAQRLADEAERTYPGPLED